MLPSDTIEKLGVVVWAQMMVPLFTVLVTLSNQSANEVDVVEVPTLIEKEERQLVAEIVAEAHGSK